MGLREQERDDIQTFFPGARRIIRATSLHSAEGWELTMDPIPSAGGLGTVIDDLAADRVVTVGLRGSIRSMGAESAPCESDLCHLQVPRRPYIVELEYPIDLFGPAGPVHPKVRVVSPEISLRTYPRHPHMNFDGTGDSWACAVSPHDRTWSWTDGATWGYLAQVGLWIFKTEVWARTGGGVDDLGKWLGSATPHNPAHVLAAIPLDGPCRCWTGRSYKDCHFQADLLAAVQQK